MNQMILQEADLVEELVDSDDKKDGVSSDESLSTIGDDLYQNEAKPHDWQKDNSNLHQRNFNVFAVLGNFPLDSHGRIINRQ
jgi:hypothetical protein